MKKLLLLGPGITYSESRFFFDGAGDFGLGIILNKMPPGGRNQ